MVSLEMGPTDWGPADCGANILWANRLWNQQIVGPTDCPAMSVSNYYSMLHKNPKERRSQITISEKPGQVHIFYNLLGQKCLGQRTFHVQGKENVR
jgi:hypothetical protein